MKWLIVFSLLLAVPAWGQVDQVIEISGAFKSVDPFHSFAVEQLTIVADNGESETFKFNPIYGTLFTQNFRPGGKIKLKVIELASKKKLKNSDTKFERYKFWLRDEVIGVEINGAWKELKRNIPQVMKDPYAMVLDARVRQELVVDGKVRGYVFDNGVVTYNYYIGLLSEDDNYAKIGEEISFIGWRTKIEEGYAFPIEGVREVVWYNRLFKDKGKLRSLIFKQNNVCIGATFDSPTRQIKVSFPSNYGERIKAIAERDEVVTAYFTGYNSKSEKDMAELHAVIYGNDTLKIPEFGFYGGADIKHDHTPASIVGKITQVNKLSSGTIINVIVDNKSYVDIDFATQKQIGPLLRKGSLIEIKGKERIKAAGEVYSKDYRIITPSEIKIDGKVFSLNQLP